MAATGETWMMARPFSVVSSRLPIWLQSPFGFSRSGNGPYNCRVASVTDGLSNTHFVSELLQGATDDIRGDDLGSQCGAGAYVTRFTPNGYQDYVALVAPWSTLVGFMPFNNYDNIASLGGTGSGSSPASAGSLCDSQPGQQLGCYNQASEGSEFAGSRSRHPGGVDVLFGDGSAHFIKNSVNALHMGCPRVDQRRRGHQLRSILIECHRTRREGGHGGRTHIVPPGASAFCLYLFNATRVIPQSPATPGSSKRSSRVG